MSQVCECSGLPGFNAVVEKKGLKRIFIATQLGIPYKALWGIVSGTMKRIDPTILRKMAELLECSTDDLLYPPSDNETSIT
jgi:DNA-binding Xre family transcriptional regulator